METFVSPDSPPASLELVLFVFLHLARGLAFIHQAGVDHRDIKLENIVIEKATCLPKFVDFGLACAPDLGDRCRRSAGTMFAIPPEVLRGSRSLDLTAAKRQDVFALGIVFHALAMKSEPFESDARGLVYERFYPPETGAPELDALLTGMLSLAPAGRPSAEQIVEKLEALSSQYTGCFRQYGDRLQRLEPADKAMCRQRGGVYMDPLHPGCHLRTRP
jgi:serine/threonine-protein kinase